VGILASSITRNQIIAFILAAFLCFLLYAGFDSIATINVWSAQALLIKQIGILYHYEAMGKGLIDSRDLIYFFSITFLFLLITKLIIGSRSW
jgi:ABC-2 type transport system permease protein